MPPKHSPAVASDDGHTSPKLTGGVAAMGGGITPTSISTTELERQMLQLERNTSLSSTGALGPGSAGGDSARSPIPSPVIASAMVPASALSSAAGTTEPPGLVLGGGLGAGGAGGAGGVEGGVDGGFGSGFGSGGAGGGMPCEQRPETNATTAVPSREAHGLSTGRLLERPGSEQRPSGEAGSLSDGPRGSERHAQDSLAKDTVSASVPEADLGARAGPQDAPSGDGVGTTGSSNSGLRGGGDRLGGRSGVGSTSSDSSASDFQRVTIGLTLAAAASSDISTSESVAAALLASMGQSGGAVGHAQNVAGYAGGRRRSSDSRSGSGGNSESRGSSSARNLQRLTQPHRQQDSGASEPLGGQERSSGHSTSGGSSVLFRPMGRCESVPEEAVFGPRAHTVHGMEAAIVDDASGAKGSREATLGGGSGAGRPEGADGTAAAGTAGRAGRTVATPSPAGEAPAGAKEAQSPAAPSPFISLAGRSFSVQEREEQQQQQARREPVSRPEHADHTPPPPPTAPAAQAPAPAAPGLDARAALEGSLRLNPRPVAGANTRRASTGATRGSADLASAMSPKGAPPTPSASAPASTSSSSPWQPPPASGPSLTLLPAGDVSGSGDGGGRLHTILGAPGSGNAAAGSGGGATDGGSWRASGGTSGGDGTGLGPPVPYILGGSDASFGSVAVGAGGAVTLPPRPDGGPSLVIQSLPLTAPTAGASSGSGGGGAPVGTAAYAATALMLLESYGTGSDWATSNMGGAGFGGSAMRGLRLSGAGEGGGTAASNGTSSLHLTGLTLATVEGSGGSGLALALGGAAADGRGGGSLHSPLAGPLDGTLVRKLCFAVWTFERGCAGIAECAWQPLRTPACLCAAPAGFDFLVAGAPQVSLLAAEQGVGSMGIGNIVIASTNTSKLVSLEAHFSLPVPRSMPAMLSLTLHPGT